MARTTKVSNEADEFSKKSNLHKCDICGKDFPFVVGLNLHKRDHIVKNIFKCDICSSAYPKKSQLIAHYR